MFKNYVIIAIRNILKYRMYSTINIVGLAVGFAAFILLSLFIRYELSWDKQNANYNRIYQVHNKMTLGGKEDIWTDTEAPLSAYLKSHYPEIEQAATTRWAFSEFLSSSANVSFREDYGKYADAEIFDIFSFSFIDGNQHSALNEPYSIVLSETLAEKLFGSVHIVGKSLLLESKYNLHVTGVYQDFPKNSIFQPSYITSLSTLELVQPLKNIRSNWDYSSYQSFVLLKKGVDNKVFDQKIAGIANKELKRSIVQHYYLHPLSEIYLSPTGKTDYIIVLLIYGFVALLILILASLNYINLSIANSSVRAKEIAIRKISGGTKRQIIAQFLSESVIITLISIALAFVLAELALPTFNKVINRELHIEYIRNCLFISEIISISIVVGILSALYPAFVVSSYKSVDLFKSDIFRKGKEKIGLKKVLVTFQFSISILLIIISIALVRQINFMTSKNLGFDQNNLLFAHINSSNSNGVFDDLRARLLKHPEIEEAAMSANIPFYGNEVFMSSWEGALSDEKIAIRQNWVSPGFMDVLKLKVVLGSPFSRDTKPKDKLKPCIINETAWKRFGWKDPIGKKIKGDQFVVIGVVKDYHLFSVHEKIPPCLIELNKGKTFGAKMYTIRFKPGTLQQAKTAALAELKAFFPNDAFELVVFSDFYKLDETFKTYRSVSYTFQFFAVLAIILAGIGLMGLISFTISRKIKEIGVRKVHGCSTRKIFSMLVGEYIVLILVASVIACPIAYLVYQNGLSTAYKVDMQVWDFGAAIAVVLAVVTGMTAFHTLKAAMSNPVEALHYE